MKRSFIPIAGALVLAGCATPSERVAFGEVAGTVEERIGQRIAWEGVAAEDAAAENAVAGLLADDLSADEAVQTALLNNPELRATYAEIGLARAAFVQAGLLSNPVFDAVFRFPEDGAPVTLDFGVAFEFLNVLYIPLRRRLAEREFEAAKLRVAGEVLDLAARTRSAFLDLQARRQVLDLFETVQEAQAASLSAAEALNEAGNVTTLEVERERLLDAEARLALSRAEGEIVGARERLNVLMGLWGEDTTWRVTQRLPSPDDDRLDQTAFETRAVRASLDLAAARQDLLALGRRYNVTRVESVVPELEVGVQSEREAEVEEGDDGGQETNSDWEVGPSFAFAIPVFDFGQAQRAAARASIAQARDRYRALAVLVRSEARRLTAEATKAREAVLLYRRAILPGTQRVLSESQLQYNAMQVGVFDLLNAKRDQIEAGQSYVEALRDYWIARAELDQLLGGSLPAGETETLETPSMESAGAADAGGH